MKTRLLHLIEILSANFWMIPLLFLLMATGLAFFNFYLDKTLIARHVAFPDLFLFFNNSQNIRALLSVSAGSVLGVAGVSFSITIASLTLASQQFGPRLLRNFMLDRFNQTVLGIFIGTFLYCFLMLQFTSSMDLDKTTPFISMIGLLILIVINLLALVFFIHHIAVSIQADTVISEVSVSLRKQLETFFPNDTSENEPLPEASLSPEITSQFEVSGQPVTAIRSGYLQAIDSAGLLECINELDIALDLRVKPGDFVMQGSTLGHYLGGEEEESESILSRIQGYLLTGAQNSAEQDPEFAIRQLVEVAVRALSPGINDPFTAIACIDCLGDNIAFLTKRQFPVEKQFDESGRLRLWIKPVTFNGIVEASFNQIRQHGKKDAAVVIHLLKTLQDLSQQVVTPEQTEAIKTQADALYSSCKKNFDAKKDQQDIHQFHQQISQLLKQRHVV